MVANLCTRSRLSTWSRETGSVVPFRVISHILYTQAEFGAFSRDSSRFPCRPSLPSTAESTYLCMVSTFSKVWINRARLPILHVVSRGNMFFSLSPFAPWNFVSRERSAVPSRVSPLILHTRAESDWLVLTHGVSPAFRDGVHMYRHPPSGQSRVYQVTHLRTDCVHCLD